jgi:hypothetical protein
MTANPRENIYENDIQTNSFVMAYNVVSTSPLRCVDSDYLLPNVAPSHHRQVIPNIVVAESCTC